MQQNKNIQAYLPQARYMESEYLSAAIASPQNSSYVSISTNAALYNTAVEGENSNSDLSKRSLIDRRTQHIVRPTTWRKTAICNKTPWKLFHSKTSEERSWPARWHVRPCPFPYIHKPHSLTHTKHFKKRENPSSDCYKLQKGDAMREATIVRPVLAFFLLFFCTSIPLHRPPLSSPGCTPPSTTSNICPLFKRSSPC